ncbi:MAG: glycosyltransferase family 4 protein, partial [Deltaproteobacteria bacterium]|nr:glycosyltransferase family 4 protein [Deltaproteobacteria bacterium]
SADLYGSDIALLNLVKNLDKKRFSPIVCLPHSGILEQELKKANINVVVVPMPVLGRMFLNPKGIYKILKKIPLSLKIIRNIIKDKKIDIIHSNTLSIFIGAIGAKLFRVKHIWHVHEIITHPKWLSFIFPWIVWMGADKVVANSNQTASYLKSKCPFIKKKLFIILNGIDNRKFKLDFEQNFLRKRYNLPFNDIIITLIGRINRLKGQILLLDTIPQILRENPFTFFLMVGEP